MNGFYICITNLNVINLLGGIGGQHFLLTKSLSILIDGTSKNVKYRVSSLVCITSNVEILEIWL